jgi:hypothetical protein
MKMNVPALSVLVGGATLCAALSLGLPADAAPTGCGFWFASISFGNTDRRLSNTFQYCNQAPIDINNALHRVAGDPKAFIGPYGLYASRAEAETERGKTLAIMKGQQGWNPTPFAVPDPLQ